MNIQNKLIYLHFPKTGGRYVSEQLIEHNVDILENIRDKPLMPMKHFKWSDISNNVNNNQTLFSIIRNPYTWYVSYYFHHLYHEKTFDYWKNLTDEANLPKPLLDRLQNVLGNQVERKLLSRIPKVLSRL